MSPDDVLVAEGLSFGYGAGGGRTRVLQDVGLRVGPGEFVALVGPNGSGKTTLLRLLLGLAAPDRGSVRLLGATPPSKLEEPWRLGYVPQRATIPEHLPATVEEVVAAGCLSRRGGGAAPPAGRPPRGGAAASRRRTGSTSPMPSSRSPSATAPGTRCASSPAASSSGCSSPRHWCPDPTCSCSTSPSPASTRSRSAC